MDARRRPRKIPMKKIEGKQSRMVAFSKRRSGLFSKAKKLEDLTGSEIAVLVISEAGKPYIHGSPAAIDRFMATVEGGGSGSDGGEEAVSVEQWIYGIDQTLTQGDTELGVLAAMKREAEEVRESLVGQLRRIQEDRFVGSLLCADRDCE